MPNYYELLGIERNATDEQIKAAYKAQSLKVHPQRVMLAAVAVGNRTGYYADKNKLFFNPDTGELNGKLENKKNPITNLENLKNFFNSIKEASATEIPEDLLEEIEKIETQRKLEAREKKATQANSTQTAANVIPASQPVAPPPPPNQTQNETKGMGTDSQSKTVPTQLPTENQIHLRVDQNFQVKPDSSVHIYAPDWVNGALKKLSEELFKKNNSIEFAIYNNAGEKIGKHIFTNPLSLADLIAISRNERMNVDGVIKFNQYEGLNVDKSVIYALKDLVRQCVIVGKDNATHYGKHADRQEIPFEKQKVYVCDLAGLQFQGGMYNSGRLVLTGMGFDLPTGTLDNEIFEKTVGENTRKKREDISNEDIEREERYIQGIWSKRPVIFDIKAYKNFVAKDFILAGSALNNMAEKNNDEINFKFCRYGLGFFAESLKGRAKEMLGTYFIEALKMGIHGLLGQEPKPRMIKRLEFPFTPYNEDIIKICAEYGVECAFTNDDALKPNSKYVTAVTNTSDPHAVTGNEMHHGSVDASIGENIESRGDKFSPILNPSMKTNEYLLQISLQNKIQSSEAKINQESPVVESDAAALSTAINNSSFNDVKNLLFKEPRLVSLDYRSQDKNLTRTYISSPLTLAIVKVTELALTNPEKIENIKGLWQIIDLLISNKKSSYKADMRIIEHDQYWNQTALHKLVWYGSLIPKTPFQEECQKRAEALTTVLLEDKSKNDYILHSVLSDIQDKYGDNRDPSWFLNCLLSKNIHVDEVSDTVAALNKLPAGDEPETKVEDKVNNPRLRSQQQAQRLAEQKAGSSGMSSANPARSFQHKQAAEAESKAFEEVVLSGEPVKVLESLQKNNNTSDILINQRYGKWKSPPLVTAIVMASQQAANGKLDSAKKFLEIANTLMNHKSDSSKNPNIDLNLQDKEGNTALQKAVYYGSDLLNPLHIQFQELAWKLVSRSASFNDVGEVKHKYIQEGLEIKKVNVKSVLADAAEYAKSSSWFTSIINASMNAEQAKKKVLEKHESNQDAAREPIAKKPTLIPPLSVPQAPVKQPQVASTQQSAAGDLSSVSLTICVSQPAKQSPSAVSPSPISETSTTSTSSISRKLPPIIYPPTHPTYPSHRFPIADAKGTTCRQFTLKNPKDLTELKNEISTLTKSINNNTPNLQEVKQMPSIPLGPFTHNGQIRSIEQVIPTNILAGFNGTNIKKFGIIEECIKPQQEMKSTLILPDRKQLTGENEGKIQLGIDYDLLVLYVIDQQIQRGLNSLGNQAIEITIDKIANINKLDRALTSEETAYIHYCKTMEIPCLDVTGNRLDQMADKLLPGIKLDIKASILQYREKSKEAAVSQENPSLPINTAPDNEQPPPMSPKI